MASSTKFEDTRTALTYIGRRTLKSGDNKEIPDSDLAYRGVRRLKSLTCGLCKEDSTRSRDELVGILTSRKLSPSREIACQLLDGLLIHDPHNISVRSSTYANPSGKHKVSFGFALLPSRSLPKGEKKERVTPQYSLCFYDLR